MNAEKIDKRLLSEIEILSCDKKIPCFVFSKDIDRTRNFLKYQNIHILNEYLFIKSFYCLASQKEIYSLSNFENINFIYSLATANCMMFVSKQILGTENIDYSGDGIGVAFIDTGLSPHCDFLLGENRVALFKDFVANKKNLYDDNGHGTFVCGVCSGSGCLSKFRYSGVAPKSKIFALKALNEKGEASANKIIDAMEWIYDNHKKQGIKVVCMSFGSEPLGKNDPIMLGADALWQEGIVVVAAAGNSGPEYQTIKSPGISEKIITVGGIDDNRYDDSNFNSKYFEIADFSSRGPAFRKVKPDVVAPSVDIISCGIKNFYTILSGTSVATPMIAGICCLILEKYPTFKPEQVKNLILKSCQSMGFEMNWEGHGVPNLRKINYLF